jgi:hypothetical protein
MVCLCAVGLLLLVGQADARVRDAEPSAAGVSAGVRAGAAHARPAVLDLFRTFSKDGRVRRLNRPTKLTVSSPDSDLTFTRLRWRDWGSAKAVARGKSTTCTADIGCTTDSTFRLIARRPSSCVRYRLYATVTAYGLSIWGSRPLELPTRRECAE